MIKVWMEMRNWMPVVMIAIVSISGCEGLEGSGMDESSSADMLERLGVKSFMTENQAYNGGENIEFLMVIASPVAGDADVRIFGIRPYSQDYIKITEKIVLEEGDNRLSFMAKAPACTTGCGGVYPGEYDILFELHVEGMIVAEGRTTIELVR